MPGLVIKHILLRNFCKNVLISKSWSLSYYHLMGTMANFAAEQKLNQGTVDPFLEPYYNGSNSSECPLMLTMESMHCEHDMLPDIDRHSCAENTPYLKEKYVRDKQRYSTMRKWKSCKRSKNHTDFYKKLTSGSEEYFILKVLSFNILAQYLLETYFFLYKDHDKWALPWKTRRQLLLQEIIEAQANVICLQEVQEDHLQEFLIPFKELGYNYLYKKRTNDKKDGLLLLYRSDQLVLLEYAKVELHQSGIELLSRDNVGIVAKLAVNQDPEIQVVVATTHLLYNPRRNDVRLGQIQLLLAEIERIAFLDNTVSGARYLPIILAGDFNLEPYSGVYRFIRNGMFQYQGKGKNLESTQHRSLSNSLVPPCLCITDNCQHYNILKHRLLGKGSNKVMLENSEQLDHEEKITENITGFSCEVNPTSTDVQTIEITDNQRVTFSSGTLTHPFRFDSVYDHQDNHGEPEATTHQGKWVTVDYIFYSDLQLLKKYRLPTVTECTTLPTIPNFAVGSDHMCLGASFKICKRKLRDC